MTVQLDDRTMFLTGSCAVEDAEPLVSLLQAHPGCPVDLTGVTALHTAIVQALLAFRPSLIGPPAEGFARTWLWPLLQRDAQR